MTFKKKQKAVTVREVYFFEQLIYDCAGTIFFAFVILLIILSLFFRDVTVEGASMSDTLHDGDRLIVSVIGYTPKCGDIVVITHGKNHDEPIIKRVIAVGGQKLSINYDTGEVAVDGVLMKEYYIKGKTVSIQNRLDIPEVIEDGYVFVMGDNREHSLDSRSSDIGLIPVENIVGKVIFRIYPFDVFGAI